LNLATVRSPIGLEDLQAVGCVPLKSVREGVGGVFGTPESACALLDAGHLVVCYPGGAREVFKGPAKKYRLSWERTLGFAKVAIMTGAPVVPFAGRGVDDSFINLGAPALARHRLGRYAVPMSVGIGPLPLPVQFRFRLGAPLEPPSSLDQAPAFKRRVQAAVLRLLEKGARG
jgi:1-acyl-sn-glycerol-3-phosphate acyltransferase